jgi:addiction module RelE/StbE family toxin
LKIRYSVDASEDLLRIRAYIDQHSAKAAVSVIAAIRGAAEHLREFPLSGRTGVVPSTREMVVPGLPFIIVYRVTKDIEILAIFHTAQDRSLAA